MDTGVGSAWATTWVGFAAGCGTTGVIGLVGEVGTTGTIGPPAGISGLPEGVGNPIGGTTIATGSADRVGVAG